jgi:hypothetical protein
MTTHSDIEQQIRQRRADMDAALPGAFTAQRLERLLARLPHADGLEVEIMANRPLMDTAAPREGTWTCIRQQLDGQDRCDDVEMFIQNQRSAFDIAEPPVRLWAAIEQALPTPAAAAPAPVLHARWVRPLVRVAAAVVLLVSGIGIGTWHSEQRQADSVMAMSEVSNEYAELENYYQSEISTQRQQLAKFTGSQSAEVGDDLQQLDDVMAELQAEMANVPPGNREQIVRAMIENYETKKAILQRVLERLERTQTPPTLEEKSPPKGLKNI